MIRSRIFRSLIVVAAVLTMAGVRAQEETDDDLHQQLPRIPPTEASEALATFRVEPGFRLELIASEPDVIDPIAMAFDEHGRMFVVEMRDYPFTSEKNNLTTSDLAKSQPDGRVRLLEDRDGDGKVDRSTVFLDGLAWPTAIACSNGGVFVASAPDIIFAKDEDGDGVADKREVHYRGFGRRNVQALLNGLRWGIDHKLYGNTSHNAGTVTSILLDGRPSVSTRGRDFRFAPLGPLETIPSAGGQYGICFDDLGNRFACSNSNHARHAVIDENYLSRNRWLPATGTAASIATDGGAAPVFRASGAEPWRVMRTRWRASSKTASRYASTELVPIGFFTSATGILVYGGETYGDELRGKLLVGDVGGNLVHRKSLERRGVTFRASRPKKGEKREFITSSDNWFRPTQLIDGPDGAIYILDMYRETIEHPYSIPERIKRHLSLTSGNDRGRIYRLLRDGAPAPRRTLPANFDSSQLARSFDTPNTWLRRTAARLIVERQDQKAVPVLHDILENARLAPARAQALYTLRALGRLHEDDLLAALNDENPDVCVHAIRNAEQLYRSMPALTPRIVALAEDDSPIVRFQATLTLGVVRPEELARTLAAVIRRDVEDSWIRTAALSACAQDSAAVIDALVGDRELLLSPEGRSIIARLAEVEGARGDANAISTTIMAAARVVPGAEAARSEILRGLGEGLRRGGRTLQQILDSPPSAIEAAVDELAKVFDSAAKTLADRKRPLDERTRAAALLAHAPESLALRAIPLALDASEPPALQAAALRALGAVESPRTARTIVSTWKQLSPSLRREAAEALFRRPVRLHTLLEAIEKKEISPADLDPSRHKQLVDHPDAKIRARARKSLAAVKKIDRASVIDKLRGALDLDGDSARGEPIFAKTCATCHRARGKGHAVGPDMETVAGRSPENLLVHILDPNREVAPEHLAYSAITKDGRVISGRIAEETPTSLRFLRAEGASDTLLRDEILSVESTGRSLMPADLEKTVDAQGLADLIAYIRGAGQPR
jgi:putative membrane-bound dehydrogenase-like protein